MEIQLPDEVKQYESGFSVMPKDTNYMTPMIFGGSFAAELDLCAAAHVTKILAHCALDGPDSAVTHKMNITFHAAAVLGDLVTMRSTIHEIRKKSIAIRIQAFRQSRSFRYASGEPKLKFIAEAELVFVTKRGDLFVYHNLVL